MVYNKNRTVLTAEGVHWELRGEETNGKRQMKTCEEYLKFKFSFGLKRGGEGKALTSPPRHPLVTPLFTENFSQERCVCVNRFETDVSYRFYWRSAVQIDRSIDVCDERELTNRHAAQ